MVLPASALRFIAGIWRHQEWEVWWQIQIYHEKAISAWWWGGREPGHSCDAILDDLIAQIMMVLIVKSVVDVPWEAPIIRQPIQRANIVVIIIRVTSKAGRDLGGRRDRARGAHSRLMATPR